MERLTNRSSQRLIGAIIQELNAISNAISYAKFNSRSHDAVIRVYDVVGNAIPICAASLSKSSGVL
jgi:hypothetical protein